MGRRKSGAFPRATVHKASGRARVRLCGREYWLGPAGSREADDKYRALVSSWVASGGTSVDESVLSPATVVVTVAPGKSVTVEPAPPDRRSLTIGGVLLAYLQSIKAGRSSDDLRGCSRWWRARQVANALDSRTAVPVELLGPRMLREIRDELAGIPMESKRGGKRVYRTRGVVNRTIREVVSMMKWAAADELVPVDRYQALQCVAGLRAGDGSTARESVPRVGVSDEAVAAILPYLPPVAADVVRFARLTSCRPAEIFALRMADVVPADGVLKYTPPRHKTAHHGKRRDIAIGPRAAAILSRWSSGKPATAIVFSRDDVRRVSSPSGIPVRLSRSGGEGLTTDTLRRWVRRACKAAGVPIWTPYQVRHAGLTEARAVGGLEGAQAVGGHSRAATTEIYAQVAFSRAADVARSVG